MVDFPDAAALVENGLESGDDLDDDPAESLFEHDPELERRRLLTDAIGLHHRALQEPDGATRAQMLQKVFALHSRWAQSQNAANSRNSERRPKVF